jgi:hypothetical protein
LRKAGFRVVTVEEGLLYELLPPGREPHAKEEAFQPSALGDQPEIKELNAES